MASIHRQQKWPDSHVCLAQIMFSQWFSSVPAPVIVLIKTLYALWICWAFCFILFCFINSDWREFWTQQTFHIFFCLLLFLHVQPGDIVGKVHLPRFMCTCKQYPTKGLPKTDLFSVAFKIFTSICVNQDITWTEHVTSFFSLCQYFNRIS